MSDVAEHIAFSRRHGRRSGFMLAVLCIAVASVLVLAALDGLWPPRETSPASQTRTPG
jgi:hypothetical protein